MVYQEEQRLHMMGTVIDLLIEHEEANRIMKEVVKRLEKYEQRFSANDSASELMKVNHNAGIQAVEVHPELYDLIKLGKHHSCAKESHLNIAIGPLVQSWRIGFSDAKVPSDKEITQLLKETNPQKIFLNDERQSVYLSEKGMFIDLGALAKGYIADLIIEYLKIEGVTSALINLGGNIVGLGPAQNNNKNYWKIGIQNPNSVKKEHLIILKIVNQSVVTSGIYERNYKNNGKTYHHILNPQTGYPIESDVSSLTILSNQSVDGEIWTTRLFGKQSEKVIDDLNQIDGIEGLVVTKEGKMRCTKGLENFII